MDWNKSPALAIQIMDGTMGRTLFVHSSAQDVDALRISNGIVNRWM
jgi:hypothetical protein